MGIHGLPQSMACVCHEFQNSIPAEHSPKAKTSLTDRAELVLSSSPLTQRDASRANLQGQSFKFDTTFKRSNLQENKHV
jgi:hypothetical protein